MVWKAMVENQLIANWVFQGQGQEELRFEGQLT